MAFDKKGYPISEQGGLWKNLDATNENRAPPYKGHIVLNGDMLKYLVTLYQNNAYRADGDFAEEGPRINLAAWLNTKDGKKYFRVQSQVYWPNEHNHLFEDESPLESAPEAAPEPKEDDPDDFPF